MMSSTPRNSVHKRYAMLLAAVAHVVAPTAMAQSDLQGAARFLPSGDVQRAIERQRSFLTSVDRLNTPRGDRSSTTILRSALSEVAPLTGPGGRDLGSPRDVSKVAIAPQIHDDNPRVAKTLRRYLEEARLGVRVLGGAQAPHGVFRETVAIHPRGDQSSVCSGVLIDRNAVLTAAHCVCDLKLNKPDTEAFVRIGDDVAEAATRALRVLPERTRMRDERFCQKAGAAGFVPGVDIAVVFFREDRAAVRVDLGGPYIIPRERWTDENGALRVSTARIAGSDVYLSASTVGLMVVGFGTNDTSTVADLGLKMFAEIPIASQICGSAAAEQQAGCAPGREAILIDWKYHQRDTCNGDSGGPAFVVDGSQYYLAAITSRSVTKSGGCGAGGIYSLATPAVVDWLRSVVRVDPIVVRRRGQ